MSVAIALIALVALQRIVELPYAARNTKRLMARGGVESGRGHYPLFVLLHAAWLMTIAVMLPKAPVIHWPFALLYAVLEGLRLWVLWALGPYWTTRIITVPGAPLVGRGPYRWLRHPNYWIVAGEIAVLPLVFGQVAVAVVFSLLNGALIAWRIRVEERALAPRRAR